MKGGEAEANARQVFIGASCDLTAGRSRGERFIHPEAENGRFASLANPRFPGSCSRSAGNICRSSAGPALLRRQHQPRTEDRAVSVIDCDYLPADKVVFPPELALLIVRKASAMAAAFEEQALDQLTKDARRALSQGTDPRRVIREMSL